MEVAVLSSTGELRKFTPRWVEHVVRRKERVFTENTWRLPVVYKFNIGRQGLRMREMARVKNERDGGERHGGGRGCGGQRN